MGQLIEVSVDVTKITKSKLIDGKGGKKYANLIISVNDDVDRFDQDVSIWEKPTDKEKADKADKNFLGNGKTFWVNGNGFKTAKDKKAKDSGNATPPNFGDDDDLPF